MNRLLLNARAYLENTREIVFQGINPGGHYKAIWCRDASYILHDWFVSGGSIIEILKQICFIWSHQIKTGKEKLIYGRGSPDMNFHISTANKDIKKEFEGALPTTIYTHYNFCEVYGKSPDIDSTALMISTTSLILHSLFKQDDTPSSTIYRYSGAKLKPDKKSKIINQLIPRMSSAIDYLVHRDTDVDCLLEQNYNEDWMDTVLRKGKIVYSQACWILALKYFTALLFELGKETDIAKRNLKLAERAIEAVDQKLWSQKRCCYIDSIQTENQGDFESGILTQDVCLFLVAIAENECYDKNGKSHGYVKIDENEDDNDNGRNNIINNETDMRNEPRIHDRGIETLNTIRKRIWKGGWPLVTESQLVKTGPAIINPSEYHNYTCWPWMTAIEMLARSRFGVFEQRDLILLSELISEDNGYSLYEWINPSTESGNGAFPFRTGISCMRLALRKIVMMNENEDTVKLR